MTAALLEFRPAHTPDVTVEPTLSATITLPRTPASCREGRHWLDKALAKWGIGADVRYRALQCVSETLGNAILHPAVDAPTTTVRAEVFGDQLWVTVSDPDPFIYPSDATSSAEHGRGLMIVSALSDGYGADETPFGKDVWWHIGISGGVS